MTANRETIVVVGAGVCGLTLARELLRAGRRVIVVEGRDRLGGRICPLSTDEFGYSAEGGVEFIHGVAAHTHRLIQEAGLSAIPIHGSTWNFEDDVLSEDMERIPYHDRLEAKLKSLQCDQPVSTFLDENFPEPKFAALRQSVIQLVQGYDAADPHRASAFTLREELSQFNDGPAQMRIKEGYGALVRYLERECHAAGAEIRLHHRVRSIHHGKRCWVECANGERLDFRRLILTVPLSLIPELEFVPALPEKVAAAKRIGFGGVIKAVIRFRDNWWAGARGKDLSNMTFLFSREEFPTWWTQFPSPVPVLTGWLAGPQAEKFRDVPPAEILELAFRSLAHIFGVELQFLREECVAAEAPNWCSDAFTRGAYTYAAVGDSEAREELRRPVADRIFFAGEALADGADASTVEGAIASGLRVSQQILSI